MAETVVLKVAMSCQGCAGAVQRALTKMQGVDSFNVDLKEQKVTVIGNIKPEDVFQTVSKTGKRLPSGRLSLKQRLKLHQLLELKQRPQPLLHPPLQTQPKLLLLLQLQILQLLL